MRAGLIAEQYVQGSGHEVNRRGADLYDVQILGGPTPEKLRFRFPASSRPPFYVFIYFLSRPAGKINVGLAKNGSVVQRSQGITRYRDPALAQPRPGEEKKERKKITGSILVFRNTQHTRPPCTDPAAVSFADVSTGIRMEDNVFTASK